MYLRDFLVPQGGGKKVFYIPNLQRGYSWTAGNQVYDLIWDLWQAFILDSSGVYYLHEIILAPDGDGAKNILDGQQRAISVLALIRAVIEAAPASRIDEVISDADERLRLRGPHSELEGVVFTDSTQIDSYHKNDSDELAKLFDRTKVPSTKYRIGRAFAEFRKQIMPPASIPEDDEEVRKSTIWGREVLEGAMTQDEFDAKLLQFSRYLHSNCYFTVSEFSNEETAFTAFATANNRGLSLSLYDLYRFYSIREAQRHNLAKEVEIFWDDKDRGVANLLESNRTRKLFLTSRWQAVQGRRVSKADIAKEVARYFGAMSKGEYKADFLETKKILGSFVELTSIPDSAKSLKKWHRVGPPLLFQAGLDLPFTLLLSAKVKVGEEAFGKLFSAVDALFIRAVFSGTATSNEFDEPVCRWAKTILDDPSKIQEVTGKILKRLQSSRWSDNLFKERLLAKDFSSGQQLRYLLARIDYHGKRWSASGWAPNFSSWTREHILPQKHSGPWKKAFKQTEFDDCCNKIGNSLLLGNADNSRFGNKPLGTKFQGYKEEMGGFWLMKSWIEKFGEDIQRLSGAEQDEKGWKMAHILDWGEFLTDRLAQDTSPA